MFHASCRRSNEYGLKKLSSLYVARFVLSSPAVQEKSTVVPIFPPRSQVPPAYRSESGLRRTAGGHKWPSATLGAFRAKVSGWPFMIS